ncbi:19035_t:CDS:2, partial [Cetraspora pellucida]
MQSSNNVEEIKNPLKDTSQKRVKHFKLDLFRVIEIKNLGK